MGYVDHGNRFISQYRTNMQCHKRHYLRIFMYLLDLVCMNSCALYRRDAIDDFLSVKEISF